MTSTDDHHTATALADRLAHTGALVNLVFHDIATDSDGLWSRFDTTIDRLHAIAAWCRDLALTRRVRLYFDDNHRSLFDLVLPALDVTEFAEVVAAVPVASIGRTGHGTTTDLRAATARGVRIAAHGFSHTRLASYDPHGALLATPIGGRYTDRPGAGQHDPATENEVLFQLVEAKEHLDALTGACREFVLPYGCHNPATLALNQRFGLYPHLTTTDPGIDTGQLLRPRFLLTSDDTPITLAQRITEEASTS
ncbi:polysaccharide deacetylase family protein [Nocardia puris]|uniref:polysaccharide deacetylase family protein n=1 Tax=Nocardia puris TaxID=208602 RepID=UPI0018963B36|nr:polysaccharide deacetylase family protein [Nocardia puris]MBF6209730.1 polysaccharide deacetylase family protein [Nocardia puris]MBF6366302.1 polysaccharide deacetylase family protein [Nocardia puris]MBF6458359.1 polysaccharide deacetylase family protein [Nocardia puris]